jgi:hypothetical protein
MRQSILAAAAAAALIGGCGGAGEESREGRAQAQVAAAPPSRDKAATAGEWRRVSLDGAGVLQFGERGERPLAALRCDAQLESLLIERMTVEPEPGVDTMKVSAGGKTERLPIMWDGASLPIAAASVRLEDPLTDRLTRLSDPILLELKGEPKLSLPPDRRIGTLIEECRQA